MGGGGKGLGEWRTSVQSHSLSGISLLEADPRRPRRTALQGSSLHDELFRHGVPIKIPACTCMELGRGVLHRDCCPLPLLSSFHEIINSVSATVLRRIHTCGRPGTVCAHVGSRSSLRRIQFSQFASTYLNLSNDKESCCAANKAGVVGMGLSDSVAPAAVE